MEKGNETGKDKIKQICNLLREETLAPAQKEAAEIIKKAEEQAKEIVDKAGQRTEEMLKEAALEIEKTRNAFEGSLRAAAQKSLQELKIAIEEKLVQPELVSLINAKMQEPHVLTKLIATMIDALEREGTHADMSVYIPSAVSVDEINALIGEKVLGKLREKSVLVAPFGGGIAVKMHKEKITVELTDEAVRELLMRYIQKEFHALFFANHE
jgi:V/A-type H+/Na+-transporting ATPase subunit E